MKQPYGHISTKWMPSQICTHYHLTILITSNHQNPFPLFLVCFLFIHFMYFPPLPSPPLTFWFIWYSTKRAYVIMICPSCIVVVRHRCRHCLASASVHSPPSHRIQDRNFIFSMNMHMCPQYMHIKYLVILTCSF